MLLMTATELQIQPHSSKTVAYICLQYCFQTHEKWKEAYKYMLKIKPAEHNAVLYLN